MKKRRKKTICPNCETKLRDNMNFCFSCGQENHTQRVSMKMFMGDFLSTYFTLDSKLLKSLKYLITKPSHLSKAYLSGKINSFLSPIKLYIFISFVFFLIIGLTNINDNKNKNTLKSTAKKEISIGNDNNISIQLKIPEEINKLPDSNTFKKLITLTKSNNFTIFKQYLESKIQFFLFLIIPLLAFILYLIFYKKTYFYIDHLVFALHLQSFFFLLLITFSLINLFVNIDGLEISIFITFLYGLICAKRFYKLSNLTTFIRLILVFFTHIITSFLVAFGMFYVLLYFY